MGDVGLGHTAVDPDNKQMMVEVGVELGPGGSNVYDTGKDSPDKLMVRPKGSTQMRTSKRSSGAKCASEVCRDGIWSTKCDVGIWTANEWCWTGFGLGIGNIVILLASLTLGKSSKVCFLYYLFLFQLAILKPTQNWLKL